MCIITDTVESVSQTNIFTCATACNTGQFVVYSNTVETDSFMNAMILPVPNPETVQFIDLSDYAKLFKDMNGSFSKMRDPNAYLSRSCAYSPRTSDSVLPVFSVGSYLASIANSVDDLWRIDRRLFRISADLANLLKDKYKSHFGFIVCRLKQGNHSYHPFAYAHDKDPTGLLFVPTFHYHPGEKHVKADWDHTIYSVMTDYDTAYNDDLIFDGWSGIELKKLPLFTWWCRNHRLQRWRKSGHYRNEDLWLQNSHTAPKPRPTIEDEGKL